MKTNRYPVLRVIAIIYKVLAVILAVLTVLGACSAPFMGSSLFREAGLGDAGEAGLIGGLITGLVLLIYGGMIALFLYTTGETITLLMDIEANTRITAELLERSRG
jgi:hypothetical protein